MQNSPLALHLRSKPDLKPIRFGESRGREAAGLGALADPGAQISFGAGAVAEAPGQALGEIEGPDIR